MPRQIDCEHASASCLTPHLNLTVVDPNTVRADGKAKTEPGAIGPFLCERLKQSINLLDRQAAALVFDFDEHALIRCSGTEIHQAACSSKLEGVLQ
jgi:hypothetical protein